MLNVLKNKRTLIFVILVLVSLWWWKMYRKDALLEGMDLPEVKTETPDHSNPNCPAGMTSSGEDGSTCEGGDKPKCALWDNPSLPRCSNEEYMNSGGSGSNLKIDGQEIKTEKASTCVQQLLALEQQIARQQQKNDDKYNADLAAWKAARDSAQNSFNNDPALWERYCKNQSPDCDYDKFFNTLQGINMDGHNYTTTLVLPRGQCLEACLGDSRCDLVTHLSNNTCYLQTVLREGSNWGRQPNHVAGLKMSDGSWKEFNDARIDGNNDGLQGQWNKTLQECKEYADSLGAGAFTWRTDKGCWPQFKPGIRHGHTINIKNRTTNHPLQDDHPFIKDTINKSTGISAKPSRNDLQYNPSITFEAIQCQDCSQEFQDVTTQDSQNVDFGQVQNCIMRIEQKELEKQAAEASKSGGEGASGAASGGSSGGSSEGGASEGGASEGGASEGGASGGASKGGEDKSSAEKDKSGIDTNTLLIVAVVVFALSACAAIMYAIFSKRGSATQ